MAFPFGIPIINFVKLLRVVLSERPSIIQLCDAPLGLVAIVLSKLTRKKLLYDAHEIWPLLAMYGFGNRLVGLVCAPVYFVVEFLVANFSDRVLVVSFGIASLFRRYYGCTQSKTVVVRNLPSLSETADSDKHKIEPTLYSMGDRFLIVFVGGIDGQRRRELARFIRAVNLLRTRSDGPRIVLRIVGGESVGDATVSERLSELVRELKCSDVVELVPWLPSKEAMKHVQQSDLCIIASEKNPYSEVSFPNKILQYIARGKPVLSPKLSDIQSTFGDAILYYENSDPDQIADLLTRIRDGRKELSEKMLKTMGSIISTLNWENESREYLRVVVETLQRELVTDRCPARTKGL
jgi:glycosyltransferase involved in cell wall biosynthesis